MKKFLFLLLAMFAFSYSANAQINYTNPEKVYFEGQDNNKLFFLIGQEETPLYERLYFAQLLKESLVSFSADDIRFSNTLESDMYVIVRDTQATTFTLAFVRSKVAQVRTQITTIKSNYSTDQDAQEYFKTLIRK